MKLGILGGSGLYQIPQLAGAHRISQETPWGHPSDALAEGEIEGLPVVFLARHGPGHGLAPSEINYRANIAALKARGCTAIVSVAACGSFREDQPPGTLSIPHQIVDRTHGRARSFMGGGIVAHVSMGDPISVELAGRISSAARQSDIPSREGGIYLTIQGPQFATRAESRLSRDQGMDIVGMTGMPEAALAREAEMAYAIAGFVTDFDSWQQHAVTTAEILKVMAGNVEASRRLITALCRGLREKPLALPSAEGWENALDSAIVTDRSRWPAEAAAHLQAISPRLFS